VEVKMRTILLYFKASSNSKHLIAVYNVNDDEEVYEMCDRLNNKIGSDYQLVVRTPEGGKTLSEVESMIMEEVDLHMEDNE
jgi:hypothetical protein